jgi:hypothetical protein
LAASTPGTPTVIGLYPSGQEIAVQVQALTQAPVCPVVGRRAGASPEREALESRMERYGTWLSGIEAEIDRRRPAGEAGSEGVSSEHFRYFSLRERLQRIQRQGRFLSGRLTASKRRVMGRRRYPAERRRPERLKRLGSFTRSGMGWDAALSAQDLHQFLSECAADAVPLGREAGEEWDALFRECALLQTMVTSSEGTGGSRALICLRRVDASGEAEARWLQQTYQKLFDKALSLDASCPDLDMDGLKERDAAFMVVEGTHAVTLSRIEEGTHLFWSGEGEATIVQAIVAPVPGGRGPDTVVRDLFERRRRWLEGVAQEKAAIDDDPLALRPVIRVYEKEGHTLDLRTGWLGERWPSVGEMRTFALSQLPWPESL